MGLKEDIYELREEAKKKKEELNEKEDTGEEELYEIKEDTPAEKRFNKKFTIFYRISAIIFGILICFLAVDILSSTNSLVMLPFSLTMIFAALASIAQAFDKDFLYNSLGKICIGIFVLMWMGFIGFATYSIVETGADIFIYGLLTVFWLSGFYMIYKYFIKKNK